MFQISNYQIKKFDEYFEKKFLQDFLEKLKVEHNARFLSRNESYLSEWLFNNYKAAESYGFSKKNEMERLLEICFLSDDLIQPLKPYYFIELMEQDQYTCEQKINILVQLSMSN